MVSSKKVAILSALARYKFLTRKQLAKLGVEKYNSAFSKHCTPLLEANWIGVMDATNYGIGHVYYLKKKGANFIATEQKISLGEINFCSNKPKLSSQTLHHRTGAIDCQIELYATCAKNDVKVIFYDRDIEGFSASEGHDSLARKTRIPILNGKYIEPDAIFMLDTSKGKKLYCLEF